MYLKAITATRNDEVTSFRCVFIGQGKTRTIDLSAAEIQCYTLFQRIILERMGVMVQVESCEGRAIEVADYFWHREMQFMLNDSAQKAEDLSR